MKIRVILADISTTLGSQHEIKNDTSTTLSKPVEVETFNSEHVILNLSHN